LSKGAGFFQLKLVEHATGETRFVIAVFELKVPQTPENAVILTNPMSVLEIDVI
jgi:hypothetical protein